MKKSFWIPTLFLLMTMPVSAKGFPNRNITDPRVETLYMDEAHVAQITISQAGTVISFPAKPSKVLLGRSGSFALEYIESDLALTPLQPGSTSNLFVYLLGRRFSFVLRGAPVGPSIVKVFDAKEKVAEARKGSK
jgi:hypothetical protein